MSTRCTWCYGQGSYFVTDGTNGWQQIECRNTDSHGTDRNPRLAALMVSQPEATAEAEAA